MSRKHMFVLGACIGLVLAAGWLLPPIQNSKVRRHGTHIHTEQNSLPSVSITIGTNAMVGRQTQAP
jgi:hypothetical protein